MLRLLSRRYGHIVGNKHIPVPLSGHTVIGSSEYNIVPSEEIDLISIFVQETMALAKGSRT